MATKNELMDELDARGVEYPSDATKAELEELLAQADDGDGSTVETIGNARVIQRPLTEPITGGMGEAGDPDYVAPSNALIER